MWLDPGKVELSYLYEVQIAERVLFWIVGVLDHETGSWREAKHASALLQIHSVTQDHYYALC